MATARIEGTTIAYEVLGTSGTPWVITPGGRFSKDEPGIRSLAEAIAARGQRVLIWDRPNTGESDVCFAGASESEMQADHLAELLRTLDMVPAVVVGGSGGARVSLLTATRHRDTVAKLGMWWISGGVYGLLILATVYCGESLRVAWEHDMEAVADLPEWQGVIHRNPDNRRRIVEQDRSAFIETMERWMLAYVPDAGAAVPGVPDQVCAHLDVPTLVFRSGESDPYHTRATSERLHALIPGSVIAEPPWDDDEWIVRSAAARAGTGHLFERWPLLAPQLLDFAGT